MKKVIYVSALGLFLNLGLDITAEAQKKGSKPDQVYVVVDKKPAFPGGQEAIQAYFDDALKRNNFYKSGTITLSMIVDKTGQVKDVTVSNGMHSLTDKQVKNAAMNMPKWEPGEKAKKKVDVRVTVSVEIKLSANAHPQENSDEKPYAYVEQMPMFPSNAGNLHDFIASNVKYPETGLKNNIEGTVYVQFIVGSDGQIREPKILKGLGPDFDQEVIRVVNLMPKWIPGKQNGRPVPVENNVPFKFRLADSQPADKK